MDYRIRFSRAMFGDVIPLTRVAEGMAQRRASGYGKLPPHRPSFEAAKREFEKLLINAVTNGDLVACNQFGATGTIDQIVGADAHAAMNPGMSSISFLYAKSKHLCDWAAAIGDDFEFQDTGVEIVTTDHKDATGKIVEPGYSRGTLEAPRKPVQAADPTEDELTASHGPAKKRARAKKPTWLDVAQPYMQDLYNQGQFKSAQMFYERLYELAGTDNSPFEKGTGKRAWALFCREAGTFIERETSSQKHKPTDSKNINRLRRLLSDSMPFYRARLQSGPQENCFYTVWTNKRRPRLFPIPAVDLT